MAMRNPTGRANYEPNSLGVGPRELPVKGFHTFTASEDGLKQRIRSETFADHYSQARQFFISQTEIEQRHIINALTFELSNVETLAIRARMVSHLLNIDRGLAELVAKNLRLEDMPKPADAARPTRQDLKQSPALSIIKNGPESFAGRKVGALVTDGVDAKVLAALAKALKKEGAMLKLIAPEVGGVVDNEGMKHAADEKLEGGPSVLFDAIAASYPRWRGSWSWRRSRRPETSSPMRSRIGSSLAMSRRRRRSWRRRARPTASIRASSC